MSNNEKEETTYTTKQAAEFLKIKPQTLDKWRIDGTGPAYSRIGSGRGRIIYRKSVLIKMLETNENK